MTTVKTQAPHVAKAEVQFSTNSPPFSFKTVSYGPSIELAAPYPPNVPFPLALAPSEPGLPLEDINDAIKRLTASGTINDLLADHGAIFFKDLGLKTAEEFSSFAKSFGWTPHEDIGNPVRRTLHAFNVATANEGPNTQPVYPHNEFGLSSHYPAYVFFFCVSAPETGGETPINNSIVLYKMLKELHPKFIEELEEKGVVYQLFYPNNPRYDTTSARTSVLQSYGNKVLESDSVEEAREKVETEIRRLPTATWKWENQSKSNQLGDLRVWQHLPGTREYKPTGQIAFFNNLVSRYLSARDAGSLDPPHLNRDGGYQPPPFYGDGSPIPQKYLKTAVDIIEKTRSLVTWKPGEVILLDNHSVQHARQPWTGPRKLLASLWDEPNGRR